MLSAIPLQTVGILQHMDSLPCGLYAPAVHIPLLLQLMYLPPAADSVNKALFPCKQHDKQEYQHRNDILIEQILFDTYPQ